jgi:hypothetical protein
MKCSLAALLVVGVSLTIPAVAIGEPITFTVTGRGGLSNPVENLHDDMFWWAEAGGRVSSDSYASTGFTIAPDAVAAGYTPNKGLGSLLLSSEFRIEEGEELTFGMDVFAGMPSVFAVDSVGFAVLLEDGLLHSVLTAVQPYDARTRGSDGLGYFGDKDFARPSPGVVTTLTPTLGPPPFTLAGHDYNTIRDGTQSNTCCLTEVRSTVTPGAGTYQLLVGAFVFQNRIDHMGVAVTNVTVPEPALLVLFGLGLGVFVLSRRQVARG